MQPVLKHQQRTRAIHRFDCEFTIINHGRIHVLFIIFPVTTHFPQLFAHHDWCFDKLIVFLCVLFIPEVFQQIADNHSVWQEKWHTWSEFAHHEQSKLSSQLFVITLFRFLQQMQMILKLLSCRETDTVDSLQHLIAGISLPVGTGMLQQLEIFQLLNCIDMRSPTQVNELPLLITGDCTILQITDQIDFVGVILEHFQSLFLGNLLSYDTLAVLGNLFHFLFDFRKILFLNYFITQVNIIIEALTDDRPYPEFCLWIQALYRLCHHMCTGMIQPA